MRRLAFGLAASAALALAAAAWAIAVRTRSGVLWTVVRACTPDNRLTGSHGQAERWIVRDRRPPALPT